jgi:hypothetical protein
VRFLVGIALMVATAAPSPALAAGTMGSGNGSGGQTGGTITAGVQFGSPPAAKGKTDTKGCTWQPLVELQTLTISVTEKMVNGIKYVLFFRQCPTSGLAYWVPQIPAAHLGTNAAAAVEERLPSPRVGSAPPADRVVVNVGMWLWTNPAQYQPVSVTAWVPTTAGIAWATTTATPIRLVFVSGEPGASPMLCQGPGREWLPQYGDELASPCMYTYQHSSEITASNVFDATLSIVWSVRWTSNVGAGGSLGEYTTSTNQPITVNEIQAIVGG